VVVADDTSLAGAKNPTVEPRRSAMVADTGEIFGAIVALAFVVFTLGFVAYAVVRPFMHRDHEHRSDLWVHLP
jgi:hypothetical protein